MGRYDLNTLTGRVQYLTRLFKNSVPESHLHGITALICCAVPESNVNPKRFECDYINHGITYSMIGDDTEPTVEGIYVPHGYTWNHFLAWYGGGLDEKTYTNYYEQPIKHWIGIGLWQWTGGRTRNLYKWCKTNNYKPMTFEGQVAFALNGEDGEKVLFNNVLKSSDTINNLISAFGGGWIRNAVHGWKAFQYPAQIHPIVAEELKNGTGKMSISTQPNPSPTPTPTPNPTEKPVEEPKGNPINLNSFLDKIKKIFTDMMDDILKPFKRNLYKNTNAGQYTNSVLIIKELFSIRTLKIILNKKYFDNIFNTALKGIEDTFNDGVDHLNQVLGLNPPSDRPSNNTPRHDPPQVKKEPTPSTPSTPPSSGHKPTPENVRNLCNEYRAMGGQWVGQAIYNGVPQCYGLSSEFSRRLGFGALNGGTAQRMPGKPIYGNASPAWYACDIGADFNWESKGWAVKFEPKASDIRVGIIFNVKPNAPYPTWGTTFAGHTGLVTNYGGGKVEVTDQNGIGSSGRISCWQIDEASFVKDMASFVYPPNVL